MILHVDMDAFYASVEERDRPELAGQCVIVGGGNRGVVCAANYAARKFGVHSAMPSTRARRLCPHAVFLPPRISYYAEVSRRIKEILHRYTPLVEPLSLDEAFLDVRASEALFGSAPKIGRRIKQEIRDELNLVASVGVAPNKFLAKLASDVEKPDGFVVVNPDRVSEFLEPLPVGRLWGVGKVGGRALENISVRTIGDFRRLTPEILERTFGQSGLHLWELAHGRDDRVVRPDREAKSISHETTFEADVGDREVLLSWLLHLIEQTAYRLRQSGLRGRSVHLKIRFPDFRTITRSRTLHEPTDVTEELWKIAADLLRESPVGKNEPVRLLGAGVGDLSTAGAMQQNLFEEEDREKSRRIDTVADQIREKFGASALERAASLYRVKKRDES